MSKTKNRTAANTVLPFHVVKEDKLAYTIEVQMEDTRQEDIAINYNDGFLHISAIHRHRLENGSDHRILLSGTQCRFPLENGLEYGITACLTDGLLRVVVLKDRFFEERYRIEVETYPPM